MKISDVFVDMIVARIGSDGNVINMREELVGITCQELFHRSQGMECLSDFRQFILSAAESDNLNVLHLIVVCGWDWNEAPEGAVFWREIASFFRLLSRGNHVNVESFDKIRDLCEDLSHADALQYELTGWRIG